MAQGVSVPVSPPPVLSGTRLNCVSSDSIAVLCSSTKICFCEMDVGGGGVMSSNLASC